MNILVLGAGFAGLAAANQLATGARHRSDVRILLFDRNSFTTMVPSLPDLAGGRIAGNFLTGDIGGLVKKPVEFLQEAVVAVDLQERRVVTDAGRHPYDYLVLATGSVTRFFGFDQHLESVYTLDSLADGERIRKDFADFAARRENPRVAVVGGGYTGLELACNLQFAARSRGREAQVSIVELKDTILPGMPERVRDAMEEEADRRQLKIITGTSVDTFDGKTARLSNGEVLEDIFLCWSTGTRASLSDFSDNVDRLGDGRIKVGADLRVPGFPEVYGAGDAAAIKSGDVYLRKAVNFSLYSGKCAARNIVRVLDGKRPKPFRPVDPGWVIPFCDTGVGKLFDRKFVRGRFPLFLHYFMCGFRNYSVANRMHFLKLALNALV